MPGVARHDRDRPHRPRGPAATCERRAGGRPRRPSSREVSRLATEQRALRRVATLVASEVSPERVFTAVSEECARVLRRQRLDRRALRGRRHGDDRRPPQPRQHRRLPRRRADPADEHSALARVRRPGRPARIDDWGGLDGRDRRRDVPHGLPLDRGRADRRRGRALGRGRRSPARTRCRPTARTGSARSASSPRSRWPARRRAPTSSPRAPASSGRRRAAPPARAQPARRRPAAARLGRAEAAPRPRAAGLAAARPPPSCSTTPSRELDTGLAELREIARGLHPAVLADHGLERALEALAARLPCRSSSTSRSRSACPSTSRRPPTTSSPRR